jgi:DNA-binding NtrC family response regulator
MARNTVAIVGDDANLFEQFSTLLAQTGLSIRRLSSFDDVVAELQTEPPGLVMIDLADPHFLSSVELATVLKLNKRTRGLPVVLVSNDAERLRPYHDQLRQRSAPRLWTLVRPFDPAETLRVLAQAFGQTTLLVREAS